MQNKHEEALKAFAEDLYYFSLEYGPSDMRTTLGYYNLGKVFQTQGNLGRCLACYDMVVTIWSGALKTAVLNLAEVSASGMGAGWPDGAPGMQACLTSTALGHGNEQPAGLPGSR